VTKDLLPYYNEELTFLRSMAADFARRHERVASRLWLEAGESVDPHVERLLQGVAFLNARVRHKLDDDFPELAQAMLGVIYPHYLRPIPSMGIIELQLHPTNVDFPGGYAVPAGTIVETEPEPESGIRCRYRTGYPVTLWPLEVDACELRRRPFQAPRRPAADKAESMLRIRLRAISKAMPIRGLELGTLRFYLHAGPATNVYRLYELLFTKTLEICLAAGDGAEDAAALGPGALRGVGFLRSEGLLPWDDRSFLGYRLLSEYFAFPQKFLFVDLELHAARKVLAACTQSLDIYFFLDTADENLQRHVSSATCRLGATPIINLFDKKAEPFTLDQRRSEYLVEPDARHVAAHEIYSIDRVEVTAPDGEVTPYQPFYSFKHGSRRELARTFWHALWRPSARASTPTREDRGRDVYLSFLDLDLNPASPANGTVRVMTTCLNRDLPSRFPTTLGRLGFDLPEGRGAVGSVLGLSPPTATLRPALGHGMIWRLISHLTLNHLSLTGGEEGAAALREILLLYDFRGSAATRSAIHGIQSVQSHRVTRRIGLHLGGFGRGIQIRLMLDEAKYSDGGAYLMAALLDRFLALYANINSFTETQIQCEQRVNQEEPWTWPMRSGEQILL
jgi:type VI secretion system protein ImpG